MSASDTRAELLYLFGRYAVEESEGRGAAWHLRRLDHGVFRLALHELRELTGADRQRFCHEVDPLTAGAMIQFMLDPETWNRVVLEQQMRSLPARRKKKAGPIRRDTADVGGAEREEEESEREGLKPVRRRRFQSRLKRRRRKAEPEEE